MPPIDLGQLRQVLHLDGLADVHVISSKEFPYSTVARLALTYSQAIPLLTRNLFLKVSEADNSKAEVGFYLTAAQPVGTPPLIRCVGATYFPNEGRSYIVFEDLTDTHLQPGQNSRPTASQARGAVKALAKVHATWWEHEKLGKGVGKYFDDIWLGSFLESLERDVSTFVADAGDQLTIEEKRSYSMMLNAAGTIWGRLTVRGGLTVTHGDAHWWNFLYPRDEIADAVRIFDWHLWHIDLGARDLAFLLALGGFAEPRPDLETELLDDYLDELAFNGIGNYSREQLLDDYRWSAIRNLNIPVLFKAQGKHYGTWQTALRRALDSFDRLKCRELIA